MTIPHRLPHGPTSRCANVCSRRSCVWWALTLCVFGLMHRMKYGLEVLSVAIKECKESCKTINGCKHFSYCHYYSRLSTQRQRCSCCTIFQPALRMQAQLASLLSELHNQQGTRTQDKALHSPSFLNLQSSQTFTTGPVLKVCEHVQKLPRQPTEALRDNDSLHISFSPYSFITTCTTLLLQPLFLLLCQLKPLL